MKIWQAATAYPWVITAPALQNVLDIASRKIGIDHESIEAIAARVGHKLDNAHKTVMRDGVAVIPVVGPLFRYANMFTQISGATSYELLAQDFINALEDPDVNAIVLTIDSPGGEVNGCAELSEMIAESRESKPILAYVSGDAASGAYWIASACDEIIVSSTSGLGSVGVVGVYHIDNEEDKNVVEIVSSQSPHKRLNVSNDDDKAILQSRIDMLADVFIDSVAKNRGIDSTVVLEKYGGGDVLIGKQAVDCGLADRLGSFEKIIQELITKDPANERGSLFMAHSNLTTEESTMADDKTEKITVADISLDTLKAEAPDLVSCLLAQGHTQGMTEGVEEGRADERQRIGSILNADVSTGRESLAAHFAFETAMDVESALVALAASPKVEPISQDNNTGFEKIMASIENPDIQPSVDGSEMVSEDDQAVAVAKRIAASSKY